MKPFARAIEEKLKYILRIDGTLTQIFVNEKLEKELSAVGEYKFDSLSLKKISLVFHVFIQF